jgi:hypothetical protein
MSLSTLTLQNNGTIPDQAVTLQAEGNGFKAAFVMARGIDVIDTQIPLTAVCPSIEEATECCD